MKNFQILASGQQPRNTFFQQASGPNNQYAPQTIK
jgi:hypothetical protein